MHFINRMLTSNDLFVSLLFGKECGIYARRGYVVFTLIHSVATINCLLRQECFKVKVKVKYTAKLQWKKQKSHTNQNLKLQSWKQFYG